MQIALFHRHVLKAKPAHVFIWLAIACVLLASVLGAWKAAGLGNAADPLRMHGLAQLILQDICISHGSQTMPDQPSDSNTTAPAHKHCAACLIAMDTALPEHGGTWRTQSEALSHARIPAQAQAFAPYRLPKPHSQAPPVTS